MARSKRRRLIVDLKVQGALLIRIVAYWLLCLFTVGATLLCWMTITTPGRALHIPLAELWTQYGPVLVVSALMLPIVVYDCVRLTNRLAGPIYRVRKEMRELAQGKPVQPIRLRQGDFWTEAVDEFNAVVRRVNELESRLAAGAPESADEPAEQSV